MPRILKLAAYLLSKSSGMPYSRLSLVVMVATGLASGFAMAALVGVINRMITGPAGPPPTPLILAFLALLVARPVLRLVSQALLLRMNEYSFFMVRMELCRRILETPMRHLEEVGRARLVASISQDVGSVSNAVVTLPALSTNLAVVVGYVAYLGWLAWPLLPVLLAVTVVGWLTFRWAMRRAVAQITAGRELFDQVQGMIRALTEGTKELKMHAARRSVFLSELEVVSRAHRREMRRSDVTLTWLGTWTETLFFVAIGVLMLVTSTLVPVEQAVLTSYVLTVLMLRTPVEALNNALPTLTQASVALKKLDQLSLDLTRRPSDLADAKTLAPTRWRSLELKGVTHTYRREADEGDFLLGPIDLALQPGELVFIVGGNGSGKTTLAKLLLGIYAPEGGEILLDGEPVTDASRDRYRQHFSVVFSDFFLFDSMLGLESAELDTQAAGYLETLHLQHKVKVVDGRLSTTDLSTGQRKRLALLAAYLEDRPIYLFDEWAADQDPQFKDVFYRELLPELQARGKTVLVISHDDRYYHVADRIVKLDEGRIRYDGEPPRVAAPIAVPMIVGAPSGTEAECV